MARHPLELAWAGIDLAPTELDLSGIVRRVHVGGALMSPKALDRKAGVQRQEPGSDFVEALAHGLAILEAWEPTDVWLTNSALSELSGLSRSTVSRLTAVLVDLGYLAQHKTKRGRFRLTAATLDLGFSSALGSKGVALALPELTHLAQELDVYAALSILRRDKIQILENVASPLHPDAVMADVGTLLPICRSASGLAAVSALPDDEVSPLVTRLRFRYGERWSTLERHMNRTKAEYTVKGYCTSVAVLSQSVGAVAVPIASARSNEVFVLACGMPATDFYPERVERSIAPRLLELAEAFRDFLPSDASVR